MILFEPHIEEDLMNKSGSVGLYTILILWCQVVSTCLTHSEVRTLM